jgi:hypothetical protein
LVGFNPLSTARLWGFFLFGNVMGILFNYGEYEMSTKKKKSTKKKIVKKTTSKNKKLTQQQLVDKANKKAVDFLARQVLSWTWNRKKKCWLTSDKKEIPEFMPHKNRIHCGWLLLGCARYSIEKYNEHEIGVRVETLNGQWAFSAASTECQAICQALLSVTKYTG